MAITVARRKLFVAAGLAALLPLVGSAPATAGPPGPPGHAAGPPGHAVGPPAQAERQFTVMTYNIYLGADITRPIGQSGLGLIEAAAATFNEMLQTNFPERSEKIAELIDKHDPDVIGLQEVAHWETSPLTDATNRTTVVDFLPVLLKSLADRGTPYEAVAVNTNFVGDLPISLTTLARLTMRDVILVRADLPTSQLKWSNPTSQNFANSLTVPVNNIPVDVLRGWSTVDIKIRGKTYRFANTHLEAFAQPIRAEQARELVAALDDSPYPVVVVGDLNSRRGVAGDSHQILVDAGYADAWVAAMGDEPGLTSGQDSDLLNFPSSLTHTIDFIMYTEGSSVVAIPRTGAIVGDLPEDRTASGLWPSDHAGVVVTLKIGRP